jgi:hypothetical protein
VSRSPGWRRSRTHFTKVEEAQLRRLVNQAFDLRETGYLTDACEAIVDWQERTLPNRFERCALCEEEDHDAA